MKIFKIKFTDLKIKCYFPNFNNEYTKACSICLIHSKLSITAWNMALLKEHEIVEKFVHIII